MWRKKQRFLNYNTSSTASGLLQAFAITSDPQYPWTPCSDSRSHPSCPEDDATKKRRSEDLIREQYININSYMDSLPSIVNGAVLINGDMTAFGHGNEWSKINSLVGVLNRPYYFGLGNHDIENNFNDCANNGCFKNSLNYLQGHVRGHNNILSSQFDYKSESHWSGWGHGYNRHGSFAYVINIGNLCLIQLQHDPKMERKATATFTNTDQYHIYPNRNWLENQLRIARDSGKIIIVNVHVKGNINSDYANLLRQYGVSAVFSGHYHTSLGNDGLVGSSIPAFISGSASQRTYLILEHYADRLEIYTVHENNWRNRRQLVHTIPISTQLPIFSGHYQIVTALNNSSVLDLNGPNNVTLWSNNRGNNQQWNFIYDQFKKAYRIVSVSNPNLVLAWNDSGGSRNVFATPFNSGYDEHFWIIERGDNGFIFRNRKNSNLVLDVYNANTNNGTNIQVHERQPIGSGFRRAQEFQLIKMS
ncbi:hypothetical protein EXW59_01285 (plasmid) [Bacillus mycoides]|uniref:RICIN domain-containing protein n=1 Tax=Bacillus mycoides TaxID=1405 RepID=UPI001C018A10|nr:RICIN domain-containing protein [Bacillus mycoides]QWH75522.1 hypothetical protein EXW59_01285 [Bacillus mycoides]